MYLEDFSVGDTFTTGRVTLSEPEIIDFARKHDPQPMHTDPRAARASIYGGLIASGWQVLAATFGLVVEAGIFEGGGQGSPGLDELRWLRPVRPGDALRMDLAVTAVRPSATRADRGYVTFRFEAVNQDEEVVAAYRCDEIFLKRSAAPSA